MAEKDKFLNGEGLAFYDSVQKERVEEVKTELEPIKLDILELIGINEVLEEFL